MTDENIISLFPQQRIKAYDGMPVTADIWEKAHSYHRLTQQSHNLFFHGTGILSGLEVVASDPADNIIFVLPGIAVDQSGQLIVLPEPVAYDLGSEMDGPLFLMISHRESKPGADRSKKNGQPQTINDEFLLIARSEIPEGDWVELARFTREDRSAALKDSGNPEHPQKNEIDLRFRQNLRLPQVRTLTSAVVYLGGIKEKVHGQGLSRLARETEFTSSIKLVVDDDLPVTPDLLDYDLVVMVAEEKFSLEKAQVNGLKGYVERGGVILMESGSKEAFQSFDDLAKLIKVPVQPIEEDDEVLGTPYLFGAPPSGYRENGEFKIGEGILLSSFEYSRLWKGEAEGRTPLRHEIRTAVEWGTNLVTYVLNHKER